MVRLTHSHTSSAVALILDEGTGSLSQERENELERCHGRDFRWETKPSREGMRLEVYGQQREQSFDVLPE